MKLKYRKISEYAIGPYRSTPKAAGLDLFSAEDSVVKPHSSSIISTDLLIHLPQGCYGRVAPRYSLAAKHSIDVGAGVVDEDYRGILKIVLFNHSDKEFRVKKFDKIAQLICEKIIKPQEIVEVKEDEFDSDLDEDTLRHFV